MELVHVASCVGANTCTPQLKLCMHQYSSQLIARNTSNKNLGLRISLIISQSITTTKVNRMDAEHQKESNITV